jgi:hypothetical protein
MRLVGEQILETVQALRPECAVVVEPVSEGSEALGTRVVDRTTPFAAMGNKPAATQNGEVLGDGWLRDGKAFSERRYGGFAARKVLEDSKTRRIGKRLKENGLAFVGHA